MKIAIQKRGPLTIKDQIKRQIRIMAETGELPRGRALPSAKDMAKTLNVNRNTIAAAYRDLVVEDILETVIGSGTFIKRETVQTTNDLLKEIVDEAVEKAVMAGFSAEQITDIFLHRVITYFPDPDGCKVLVVECNQEAIEDISFALRRNLSVETVGLLIQDLEAAPCLASQLLRNVDLIVCGFRHAEEFRNVVPHTPVELVAVFLKPEARIMNELMQLPPGTTVGFTCTNQRATETFYEEAIFSGGSTLIKIWAGMDNRSGLRDLVEKCQVIFATSYVYDRIRSMTDSGQRVMKVDLCIDQANIALIGDRLRLSRYRKIAGGFDCGGV